MEEGFGGYYDFIERLKEIGENYVRTICPVEKQQEMIEDICSN